jgi:carboxyl-terminal processing protease
MMIASNRIGGGTVNNPDQCAHKWVNFASMTDAESFSPNVIAAGGNLIFMASVLSMSQGDDPDVEIYVPTMGVATFPMGVPKVLLNGIPAITLMCPSISNDGNTTQGCVANPSPVNVLIMYAGSGAARPAAGEDRPADQTMTFDDLAQLAEALRDPSGPGRGALLVGDVGYICIDTFSPAVPSMVHGAIRDLEAQGMRGLILDLRDNPGGEVTAALELAGDFLEPGTLLATLVDRDGDATEYRARAGAPCRAPVVLLVNRRTASAAELFAGCLQAHGRALVAGERTYGKGVAQVIARRPEDGGAERMSAATCLLPNGEAIHGVGIRPDVELVNQAV